jgi:hypothetical protein
MRAEPLIAERLVLDVDAFVELVVWQLPKPLPASLHPFKYRLAYVVRGECVVRYDNESGKGDHRHFGGAESYYQFRDVEALQVDFWNDVNHWEKLS